MKQVATTRDFIALEQRSYQATFEIIFVDLANLRRSANKVAGADDRLMLVRDLLAVNLDSRVRSVHSGAKYIAAASTAKWQTDCRRKGYSGYPR